MLTRALQESEQLLGELSVMTRQHTTKVNEFSHSLTSMEKSVNTEIKELSKWVITHFSWSDSAPSCITLQGGGAFLQVFINIHSFFDQSKL